MRIPIIFLLLVISFPFLKAQTTSYTTQQESLPCLEKRFSVVAHIALDSLGQANLTEGAVTGQIAGLNGLFDPICVSFEVCEFRYIEDFQLDSIVQAKNWAELQTLHHQAYRINIFFAEEVWVDNEPVGGFASLGGVANPNSGGLMISKSGLGSIPHEMGHYFGLFHTFESGDELVDGSNCDTSGDFICDTPADPGDPDTNPPETLINTQCRFIAPLTDANGEFFDPDVGNIMSYYGCDCDRFSFGQYLRMANTYLSSPTLW